MTTHVFNKVNAVLTNEEVVFICRALKDDHLKVLCLRACTIRGKELKRILQLAGSCRSLQQLTFNIGMVTSVRHIQLLAHCVHTNTSLTGLHVHGSDLGDKGMTILGHALSKHPGIVSLDLGDCKLSDLSMDVLYSLLLPVGNKPGLTELTLSDNPRISALGWAQFGMCLANCNSLRWLFLDYNPLGDYGASCVLVALAASQSVQVLDLEGCALTEHTGQVMLHLVQNHLGGLCRVQLSNNRIRTSTIESIRKQLNENHLDDSCNVSTVGVDDLFSLNESQLPALDKSETSSSSSSSTGSHSDVDGGSDDDMNTPGHLAQQQLKRAQMPGKHIQPQADKHTGKGQSRGLKKKTGNSDRREKQVNDSERQNGQMERQNGQLLTGIEGKHQKEKHDNSTHKSNQHKKHSEKKGKQSTTCRGGAHQMLDTATSAPQAQIHKYDKKKTSVKQQSQKSPENVCSNDELQEADGVCDRKHQRSVQGGDGTISNNDQDQSRDGSGNSEDELQEVSVFYQ